MANTIHYTKVNTIQRRILSVIALTLVHWLRYTAPGPDSVVIHQVNGEIGMVVGDNLRDRVCLALLHL